MDVFFRSLCDTFEMVQQVRISAENRLRAVKQKTDEDDSIYRKTIFNYLKEVNAFEDKIVKTAEKILKQDIVYNEFLSKINGIGSRVSLRLLSLGLDINRELSDWNAYFGLVPFYYACKCEKGHKILLPRDPRVNPATCTARVKEGVDVEIIEDTEDDEEIHVVNKASFVRCGAPIVSVEQIPPRRKAGYIIFWNPDAKKTYYIVTDYWVKNKEKSFYGLILKKEKEKLMSMPDAVEKGYVKIVSGKTVSSSRCTKAARRKAFKIFLAHLYQASRELNGMPYRMPYAFEYLKHDDFIDWKEAVEIDQKLKAPKKKRVSRVSEKHDD